MLVNISMKFHENILNGLKVIERTQFCHRNCYLHSKGYNSKTYIQELWFLRSVRRRMLINISMTFHENILNGFQVTERTRFCDGRTDRQTICPPTLKWGDIKLSLQTPKLVLHLNHHINACDLRLSVLRYTQRSKAAAPFLQRET